MAYATVDNLRQRLGDLLYARLTDRVAGVTADATVAGQLLEQAQAEAESYLARRYRTPVDVTAHPELVAVLRERVLDLAEYAAWKSSPFVSDPPQRVQRLYEAAQRWLADVAAGRVCLPAAAPPGAAVADGGVRSTGQTRRFTADELDGL